MRILIYLIILTLMQGNKQNDAISNAGILEENIQTEDASDKITEDIISRGDYYEYDFDMDGNMEFVKAVEGVGITNYIISKRQDNQLIEVGTITVNDKDSGYKIMCQDGIKKFYNAETGSYIYYADYIQEKDEWFYYKAVQYELVNNQLETNLIASVSGIVSFDNQMYIVEQYFDDKIWETTMIDYKDYEFFGKRAFTSMSQYKEVENIDLIQNKIDENRMMLLADLEVVEFTENINSNSIECWGKVINMDSIEASLTYEEGKTLSELGQLEKCENLAYLYIVNNTITPLKLAGLHDSANLKSIWIPENVEVSSIGHLKSVEVLLGNVDKEYAEILLQLDNLKFLMLDTDSSEADYFKFLSSIPQLEGVYLTSNVSDEQMNYIKNNFPNIKFIYKRYY